MINMREDEFILVLGLGITGISSVKYLLSINKKVMIFDDNYDVMVKMHDELKNENLFLYNEQSLQSIN
jgi:UDP-N-acetylmuramoylalanine-D-glutamate ligase